MTASTAAAVPVGTAHPLAQKIRVVHLSRVHPHPANIRESLGDVTELAASARRHGLLQPLLVQPHPDRAGDWRVVAGHRRYAAAQHAGLDAVPVVVRHGLTEEDVLELMLVENCQRRELNPMERAEALGALINRGRTQREIADSIGKSVSWVNYYLTLLDLDTASRQKIRTGQLPVTKAIGAIRKTRARTRKQAGSAADFSWEPDHFTTTHPLAKRARVYCDAREHTMRRRIGDVACGQCWETAIRLDERRVIEAEDLTAADSTTDSTTGAGRAGGAR